ncbi:thioredoxin domain-containing protein [Candidatus Saccharibacteria bacterium]|nr:thioredoxin domain-containing protein [Candidatus Saccharibacteria bacterium]
MNQKIGKIIAILILVGGVVALIAMKIASQIDYSKYNLNDFVSATADTGNFDDNIKGDRDAPVKIIEYADYQCEYCALYNPYINKLVEKYDGKVAVIFRTFLLSYHNNATAAASAANAAALQGYWREYADTLFANQNDWYYAESSERLGLFVSYFNDVTEGKGDVDKFKTDMRSKEVSQKITFDMGAGQITKLTGTPAFYINGEPISPNQDEETFMKNFAEKIDPLLQNNSSSEEKSDTLKQSE